jgi:hypothetical protein
MWGSPLGHAGCIGVRLLHAHSGSHKSAGTGRLQNWSIRRRQPAGRDGRNGGPVYCLALVIAQRAVGADELADAMSAGKAVMLSR